MKNISNNNDSELVEKAKKGNEMAFNFLMNTYSIKLLYLLSQ